MNLIVATISHVIGAPYGHGADRGSPILASVNRLTWRFEPEVDRWGAFGWRLFPGHTTGSQSTNHRSLLVSNT